MRFLLILAALVASTLAFAAALGIGGFLAGVEESGARGAGLIVVAAAVLAFAAALFVVFAPARLRQGRRRAIMVLVALLAAVPMAATSAGALYFSGNPMGSALPYVDWAAFAVGIVLALGAVAVVALALMRPARSGVAAYIAHEPAPGAGPGEPAMLQHDEGVRVTPARSAAERT